MDLELETKSRNFPLRTDHFIKDQYFLYNFCEIRHQKYLSDFEVGHQNISLILMVQHLIHPIPIKNNVAFGGRKLFLGDFGNQI